MIVIRKDFSLFILFLCSIVYCEDKGIQLYNSNQFDKAREYYEKILLERKEDAIASFGLGSTAFQQNDLLSAMEGFESALNTDNMELKSNAYYNMGNVLVENQRLEESLAFYRKSLELNPNDLDSKINYELVKIKLQEQQKEKNKESNEENDDQDKSNDSNNNSDENNTNDSEQDNQNQNENDDNQSDSSKNNENEQENNKQDNKDNKDDKEQGDKNSSDNKNKQDDLQQDKQSATAILDALKNNEKINKKMQISQSKRKKLEKDW